MTKGAGSRANPGNRQGETDVEAGAPVTDDPARSGPESFAKDIKRLFRPRDQESMLWHFDLWSYDDVSLHADGILAQLRAGTMPYGRAWPEQHVARFQRWVATGKAP